jgi:hypothetical protein
MKESVTYQAIIQEGMAEGLAKGEVNEARKILLLFGRDHLGEPPARVLAAINALADVRQLEDLTVRVHDAASWQALLGDNGAGRRGRGKASKS